MKQVSDLTTPSKFRSDTTHAATVGAQKPNLHDLFMQEGQTPSRKTLAVAPRSEPPAPKAPGIASAVRHLVQAWSGAPYPDVPRVMGNFFLGMLPMFEREGMHAVTKRLWDEAEPRGLAYGYVGPQQIIVLRDARLVQQFFSPARGAQAVRVDLQGNGPLSVAFRIFGDNVFTSHGDNWQAQRQIISKVFYDSDAQSQHYPVIQRLAREGIARLMAESESGPVNMSQFFAAFALEAVGRAALGVENVGAKSAEVQAVFDGAIELAQDAKHALKHLFMSLLTFQSLSKPGPIEQEHRQQLRAMMDHVLLDPNAESIANTDNLLRQIWQQQGGDNPKIDAVYEQGAAILLASHETTAALMTWTFNELQMHPDILTKLAHEQHAQGDAETTSARQLLKLPYLDQVVKESLRLHSPGPDLARMLEEPFVLDTPEGAVTLPKGAFVFVSPYENHREPHVWGKDAMTFRPERFSEVTASPFEFMPFGRGARACAGNPFALLVAKAFFSELARSCQIDSAGAKSLQPVFRATLKIQDNLMAQVTPSNPRGPAL